MDYGFFNGQFISLDSASVNLEDRGYQFGDGIYEVTRVYNGKCFALDRHLARCRRSMRELRIPITYMDEELTAIHYDLIQKSGIKDGTIYFQFTRGTAKRTHAFPDQVIPNLSMTIHESTPNRQWQEHGIECLLCEDLRWLRCDIKSLNLLGSVLAKQAAHDKGLQGAIQFRKDTNLITEGSSSNFFIVKDGLIWTHPTDHLILKGVTRSILFEEIIPQLGYTVVEKAFTPEFALSAEEAFVTSTSLEVTPVIAIDGHTIGNGTPGKITQSLLESYRKLIQKECYQA
ncbi:MAG: D-amino-acid transaminase [Selenomonas sp.]|uniref:D-amino-acid transaminase n=1 Tax=Selenomonas sp. TaxID=2053611 RepID=UPI0025F7FF4C|nr:D-amino-acid transaminase [Selenomonas sp.]MCR5439306.1 D-amino-acid transaminase [Selenomonas sp.]